MSELRNEGRSPVTKREVIEAAARGEGCLGRSQDDEPVFVIVARDVQGASIVRKWAETVAHLYGHSAKIDEAVDVATAMDTWQAAHGSKVPD